MPQVIPPVPDRTDEFFWNGIAEQRLLVQQCASCGLLRMPPVPMCGSCHATAWNPREVSGSGTIYTWILSHHPSEPDAHPRIVVLVQLAEGPRIVSNLVDVDPADVRNELAVTVCFRQIDGVLLPLFQLAEEQR